MGARRGEVMDGRSSLMTFIMSPFSSFCSLGHRMERRRERRKKGGREGEGRNLPLSSESQPLNTRNHPLGSFKEHLSPHSGILILLVWAQQLVLHFQNFHTPERITISRQSWKQHWQCLGLACSKWKNDWDRGLESTVPSTYATSEKDMVLFNMWERTRNTHEMQWKVVLSAVQQGPWADGPLWAVCGNFTEALAFLNSFKTHL